MRTNKEILKETQVAEDKVWYGRHQCLMEKVYPKELKENPKSEKASFIKGGIKVAKEMEKKYGKKNLGNLGPYSEMDWGMLNGRLETLRWVLGEDWGMLDT